MHFRQKLIFMALGSILTLAGYLLTTLTSDVTAQNNETNLGDIICDSITIRDGQIEIIDENNRSTLINSNGIEIFDGLFPLPRIRLYYQTSKEGAVKDSAVIVVRGFEGDDSACLISSGEINFLDENLSPHVRVNIHGIWLSDENDKNYDQPRLSLTKEGITLRNKEREPRVSIGTKDIRLYDKNEIIPRIGLSTRLGSGSLMLSNKEKPTIFIGADIPIIKLWDMSGKEKVLIGIVDKEGSITSLDRNGDIKGFSHHH